jgi:hypothetical protein
MKHMLKAFYTRTLVIYLVLALVVISTAAGPAEAMLLPASPNAAHSAPAYDRAADISAVQKTLESKEIRQKLLDYGLTPEETEARIASLSDDQLHRLAVNLDSVQAGGDSVLGVLLGLVIIALLVVLIIYLLEGRIEIKKK